MKYKSVKFQLQKLRDQQYPKKPDQKKGDTSIEIHKKYTTLMNQPNTLERFGLTLDKNERLYVGSVLRKDYTFHVFASQRIIENIKKHMKKRNYLMDGTFSIAPRLFYQLLIIAVQYKNDVRNWFYSYPYPWE